MAPSHPQVFTMAGTALCHLAIEAGQAVLSHEKALPQGAQFYTWKARGTNWAPRAAPGSPLPVPSSSSPAYTATITTAAVATATGVGKASG